MCLICSDHFFCPIVHIQAWKVNQKFYLMFEMKFIFKIPFIPNRIKYWICWHLKSAQVIEFQLKDTTFDMKLTWIINYFLICLAEFGKNML
jgi:hypothetical protein